MRSVLTSLALAAAVASAQPTVDHAQRLRRLDSLAVVRLEELRRADRAEIADRRMQTIEVDGVRLRVDSVAAEWAGEGFRLGWQAVSARGGSWAERIVPELDLRVVVDGNPSPDARALTLVAYDQDNPTLTAPASLLRRDALGLRNATTALFDRLLQNSLDVEFKSWLFPVRLGADVHQNHVSFVSADNSLFGPVTPDATIWHAVRFHAARVPATSTRQCLAGSVAACAASLGIGTGTHAPLSTWYDPSDYRWLWSQVSPGGDSAARVLQSACGRGAIDACERFVAATRPGAADAPLAHFEARRTLLMLALETGGPGAVDRLLESRGPIADRLAVVAGVSFESLLATWQQRVAAAPSRQPRVHPFALVTGLLGAITLLGFPRRRA